MEEPEQGSSMPELEEVSDTKQEENQVLFEESSFQSESSVSEETPKSEDKAENEGNSVDENNPIHDNILVLDDKLSQDEKITMDEKTNHAVKIMEDEIIDEYKIIQDEKTIEEDKIVQDEKTIEEDKIVQDEKPLEEDKIVQGEKSIDEDKIVQDEKPINEDKIVQDEKLKDEEFQEGISLKKQLKGIFSRYLFFTLSLLYLEVVFHFIIYGTLDEKIIFPILFAFPFGGVCTFITGIFKRKWNKLISLLIVMIITLCYIVQEIYYYIFKAFLSVYSIGVVGTDVLEFWKDILSAVQKNFLFMILLFIPFLVYLFVHKFLSFDKVKLKIHGYVFGFILLLHLLCLILLRVTRTEELYSPYKLYHNTWIQEFSVERLGLMTAIRQDISNLIFGSDELGLEDLYVETTNNQGIHENTDIGKSNESNDEGGTNQLESGTEQAGYTPGEVGNHTNLDGDNTQGSGEQTVVEPNQDEIEPEVDRSPNILEIDFAALSKNETNQTVQTLHNYFSTVTPTNKNEYTGYFEGYNLIMLTAEGFSPYAVDEKVTPTLYRLINEGFVFNNFYTPLWWASTSDGEYVACTSLIPKSGVTSFYESGSNSMPFGLGNQFNQLGVNSRAYHNHTYTYYHRDVSHPNMGYEYKGVGNGLEISKVWPESDYEMMVQTIPEYINDEQFHVYYMTVSGHMNYTFIGNMMSYWNREAVKELPYSDEAKAYIACNVELDKALAYLIEQLEAAGVAKRTVIALSADHYPYGLEKDKIDEIAGHEVEENFELYKNHFILWSPSIEEPIVVDKACSSLDILPTLSNLFNLPYDSRLLMGQDIFSDSNPLVMLSNRSFITDKVMYNSTNGEITMLVEEELPEDYIKNISKIVNNKFKISTSILENDYYGRLGLE